MQWFEASRTNRQNPVHLLLSAVEIAAAMREGVGEVIRRAGLESIGLLMEQEVGGTRGVECTLQQGSSAAAFFGPRLLVTP